MFLSYYCAAIVCSLAIWRQVAKRTLPSEKKKILFFQINEYFIMSQEEPSFMSSSRRIIRSDSALSVEVDPIGEETQV